MCAMRWRAFYTCAEKPPTRRQRWNPFAADRTNRLSLSLPWLPDDEQEGEGEGDYCTEDSAHGLERCMVVVVEEGYLEGKGIGWQALPEQASERTERGAKETPAARSDEIGTGNDAFPPRRRFFFFFLLSLFLLLFHFFSIDHFLRFVFPSCLCTLPLRIFAFARATH